MTRALQAGGNPMFLALDISDCDRAVEVVRHLSPELGGVKVGMEFFFANGRKEYDRIRKLGLPIMLDLKLHDIPATVAAGIRSLAALHPALITIHAGGGFSMMQAALAAASETEASPRIVAVGLLTSLEESDLEREGIQHSAAERMEFLGANAIEAGVDALVCSPRDIMAIRQRWGNEILLITPGIRPADAENHDQKRTLSAREASMLGADILVIGRPILNARDPLAKARAIRKTLDVPPSS